MKNVKIFQVDLEKEDGRYLAFTGLEMVKDMGLQVSRDNYQVVWEGQVEGDDESIEATLEGLYLRLNAGKKPADYKGHSLSVSDVVELDGKYYYCDSFGFEEIKF